MGPCNDIIGPWNVNRERRNVNSGPWNVIMELCNVIMGPRNVIMRPWNMNRGRGMCIGSRAM